MTSLKKLIKVILFKIFINKHFARFFIKYSLNLHNFFYKLSSELSILLNNGVHPKHQIIKYKEWFAKNINNESVVIDVGCSTGLMTKLIGKKAKFVYGIDFDAKSIQKARLKNSKKNIIYINDDVTKLNFKNFTKVDIVALSNVLEHINNRINFLKKLRTTINWNNNAKKIFLIRVPLIDRDWITVYKKEMGVEYMLDKTHFIEYTFNCFVKELNSAGIYIDSHTINYGEIYAVCIAKN